MNIKQFLVQALFGIGIFYLVSFLLGFAYGASFGFIGQILLGVGLGVLLFRWIPMISQSEWYQEENEDSTSEG